MHTKPMKPILSFLIILLSLLPASAQNGDKKEDEKKYPSLLWEISGNGLTKNSYLYGTMHVSNKVAFHLSDSFFMAINSVDKVALESDPSFWIEEMFSDKYTEEFGSQYLVRPYVADFYSQAFKVDPIESKTLGQIIGHENYLMNGILYRNTLNTEHEESTYLDMYIYQAGKKLGKEVIGLEDFIESQRLVEKSTKPEKNKELLKKYKKQYQKLIKSGKMPMEMLEDAYRRGDLDLLDSLQTMMNPSQNHRRYMLDERNRIMADNMDSVIQSGSALFSGIGSAHLPGDSGVIEMLRAMGYTVRPVTRLIGQFSRDFRDTLEKTYINLKYEKYQSSDGFFEIDVPAPMYEMPENFDMKFYYCPEMINGTQFHISRYRTYAPLLHQSREYIMERIDSLLYENIPGKIETQDRITQNGYPAFDIKNKTRKGDYQRYRIVVTDMEMIVIKVAGTLDYMLDNDYLDHVFNSIKIKPSTAKWSTFDPPYGSFQVDLPENRIEEDHNDLIADLVSSRKSIHAFDPSDSSYYYVGRLGYHDFSYIEEDTFELSYLAKKFIENQKYTELNRTFGDLHGQPTIEISCKDSTRYAHLKYVIHGPRYFFLLAQTDDSLPPKKFFESFNLTDFKYADEFEEYTDTTLFYTVNTPVKPQKASDYSSYYNMYGYGDDEERDNSHLSENKGKQFLINQTDEYIYVGYQKYHRYQSYPSMDSMWSHITRFSVGRSMVKRKYEISEDSSRMDLVIVDTNSNRMIEIRSIQKAGVLYRIYYVSDTLSGRSEFAKQFFETFKLSEDTTIGTEITLNKADLLFEHINGDDSTKREQAFQSLSMLSLEDRHFDQAVSLFDTFNHEDFTASSRAELLVQIGLLKNKKAIPFLRNIYNTSIDTPIYQTTVLRTLALRDEKEAISEFKKLLEDETPLVGKSEIRSMLYPLSDSLELTKALFPMLFDFTRYPEYRDEVYDLFAAMLDSNIVKGRKYKKYKKAVLRDAKDQLKRAVGSGDDEKSSPYSYYAYSSSSDVDLSSMNRILLEFCSDPKVQEYYGRIDRVNDLDMKIEKDLMLLKHDEPVNDTLWDFYAAQDAYRLDVYRVLKKIDKLDLVTDSLISQQMLVQASAYTRNGLREEDSLTYLFRKKTSYYGADGYIYFFKYKSRYGDNDWKMSYYGPQPIDSSEYKWWSRVSSSSFAVDPDDQEEVDKEVKELLEGLRYSHRGRVVTRQRGYYYGESDIYGY